MGFWIFCAFFSNPPHPHHHSDSIRPNSNLELPMSVKTINNVKPSRRRSSSTPQSSIISFCTNFNSSRITSSVKSDPNIRVSSTCLLKRAPCHSSSQPPLQLLRVAQLSAQPHPSTLTSGPRRPHPPILYCQQRKRYSSMERPERLVCKFAIALPIGMTWKSYLFRMNSART